MGSLFKRNPPDETTLVLTQELLTHFGECDSILHTPFSPGDKVRRCGTCGRIIRAELISDGDCPYAQTRHAFKPVPVLTAEDLRTVRLRHDASAPDHARPSQPEDVPPVRLSHREQGGTDSDSRAPDDASTASASGAPRDASAEGASQTSRSAGDWLSTALLWASALGLVAVLIALAVRGISPLEPLSRACSAVRRMLSDRSLIRLRILFDQVQQDLAWALVRAAEFLRRIFPFLG